MKGRKEEPEKDNAERWLLTYADLITLLLVLFIVLYSMSQVDSAKFTDVSESLAIVFGQIGRSGFLEGGRSVIEGPKISSRRELQNTAEKIKRMIASMKLQGRVNAQMQERGLVISVRDTVFFERGSAELNKESAQIMMQLGKILNDMPNMIRIEGHTDNDPIHTEKFPSNWELSTTRAINVLHYLIESVKMSPERLSAAGYGEYKPIAPNTDERSKAQNRRVDIVVLSTDSEKDEPKEISQQPHDTHSISSGENADESHIEHSQSHVEETPHEVGIHLEPFEDLPPNSGAVKHENH